MALTGITKSYEIPTGGGAVVTYWKIIDLNIQALNGVQAFITLAGWATQADKTAGKPPASIVTQVGFIPLSTIGITPTQLTTLQTNILNALVTDPTLINGFFNGATTVTNGA